MSYFYKATWQFKKIAPSLIHLLKNNDRVLFQDNGRVPYPGAQNSVSLLDLMRTVLVNKTPVHPDVNNIVQQFMTNMPTASHRNKNLKKKEEED